MARIYIDLWSTRSRKLARPRLPEQPPCACAPSKGAVANGPEVLHFNITAASSQHHQCIRSTSPQHHQIRFSIYKCKPSVRPKSAHQKGCICIWSNHSSLALLWRFSGVALALLWRCSGASLALNQSVTGSASANRYRLYRRSDGRQLKPTREPSS